MKKTSIILAILTLSASAFASQVPSNQLESYKKSAVLSLENAQLVRSSKNRIEA